MKSDINTLTELREEKKKLDLELEITKREMSHSLGIVRTELKQYLLNRVVLPAGAVGLTAYGLKKMASSNGEDESVRYANDPSSNGFINSWLPLAQLAMTVATTYFGSKAVAKNEIDKEEEEEVDYLQA